jgi:uncharacterized protein YqjF (DUF2071 family)
MQIVLNNLLFINYAVCPEKLRRHIPDELDLDTVVDQHGTELAFVSAVVFKIAEVRSDALPIPNVSFNQINYRAYIRTAEHPAVYFLDLRVGSRMIAASAGFFKISASYESIDLEVRAPIEGKQTASRYVVESEGEEGLVAQVGIQHEIVSNPAYHDGLISSEFITERPLGFIKTASGAIHKAEVAHQRLDAIVTDVESVRCRRFEALGIMDSEKSQHPYSVFYVADAVFDAKLS